MDKKENWINMLEERYSNLVRMFVCDFSLDVKYLIVLVCRVYQRMEIVKDNLL